jgi:hypothetical protein
MVPLRVFTDVRPMPRRRNLLRLAGAVGVGGTIGVVSQAFPIRTRLHDVRLKNDRTVPTSVTVRLDADGKQVLDSTFDLDPLSRIHLPCEWPRAAWSYRVAVRPEGHDEWESITWNEDGRVCKKISINDAAATRRFGPVTFRYTPDCPYPRGENSCE